MKSDDASSRGAKVVCDIILRRAWGCTRDIGTNYTGTQLLQQVNKALRACIYYITFAWLMAMHLQSEFYKQGCAHTP